MNDSFDYWDNLRQSTEAPLAGVAELSAYIFSSTNEKIVRVRLLLHGTATKGS